MPCKDAVDISADFVDHTLTPSAVAQLQAHLRYCAPCRAYLNTYRKTRGVAITTGGCHDNIILFYFILFYFILF